MSKSLRIIAGLGLLLILATALFSIPGSLTWDSGTYHLMVKSLKETGSFFITNGYEEFSSPLLAVGQTLVSTDKIVSQYPEYYTLLSLPFYAAFGYRGLMVLNAVAFFGIGLLIYRMTRWFSSKKNLPIVATLIYAMATYAIEFTQSSYPHLTSTFLILASIWLLWGGVFDNEIPASRIDTLLKKLEIRSFLSGLLFGISIGVRLDSIFAGLALIIPLIAIKKLTFKNFGAFCIGILPPLLGLAFINMVKFGVFIPFSYGKSGSGFTGSLGHYLPIAMVCAILLAVIALYRVYQVRLGRKAILVVLTIIASAIVVLPQGRRLLFGVFQIIVDMRLRPDIPEPALRRSIGGAVVYASWVKKALLESCPYFVLIIIPAVCRIVKGEKGTQWLLWLVPFGYIGFYGYLAWHGSIGWNMRYLNPVLPFLAILTALETEKLWDTLLRNCVYFWIRNYFLWLLFLVILFFGQKTMELQEALFLNVSLMFAVVLLLLQGIDLWVYKKNSVKVRKILALVFVTCLVWSFALTTMDYLHSSIVRNYFLNVARNFEPKIETNALIMTSVPDITWPLLDSGKEPVIADYMLGTEKDAIQLVERVLNQRPVYWISGVRGGVIAQNVFSELQKRNIMIDTLVEFTEARDSFILYKVHLEK